MYEQPHRLFKRSSICCKSAGKAILSGGDGFQERLESLIQDNLKCRPQDFILAAAADHELMKQHTHDLKPTVPGMYLKLLHGRAVADEEMDNWGPDGPWIGPLKWFHCTYLSDIGIGFAGGRRVGFAKLQR